METDVEVDISRPEGEREAFALWEGVCKRKMRCVAEATNKPIRGLYLWQSRYNWKLEADVGLAEVLQLAQDVGKLGFTELLSTAAMRLKKMLEDDEVEHKDHRENIRLLVGITLATQQDGPSTLIDARSIHMPGGHDPHDALNPLRRATNILEANVASTNNERRKGKRNSF